MAGAAVVGLWEATSPSSVSTPTPPNNITTRLCPRKAPRPPTSAPLRPQVLLDGDHAEGAGFAAKQNASADTFLAAEEADKGMAELSGQFRQKGGEIYLSVSK